MRQEDMARELEGVVVSWESSQDKYWKGAGTWTGTKQAKKFGEDLSLSDYQEAATVHPDPRRREKFKNVGQWMKQQGPLRIRDSLPCYRLRSWSLLLSPRAPSAGP